MLAFSVGHKIPNEIEVILKKDSSPLNVLFISGNIDMFIAFDDFYDEDIISFNGVFNVLYQEFNLPFLILNFDKFTLDIPFTSIPETFGNLVNLYFLNKDGYILKGFRVFSLDIKIYKALLIKSKEVSTYSSEKNTEIIQEVYKKYDLQGICKNPRYVQRVGELYD